MKKFFKILALGLVLVPCALVFAACGNNDYTMNAAQEDVQEMEAVSTALNNKAEAETTDSETLEATLEIKVAITGLKSTMEMIQTTVDSFDKIYEDAKELAKELGINVETYLNQVGLTLEKNGNSFKISVKNDYSINVDCSKNKINISYVNAKDSSQNSSIVIEKNDEGTNFKLDVQLAGKASQTVEVVKVGNDFAFQTSTKVGSIYKTVQVKVGYSYDKTTNTATITAYTTKTVESSKAPSSIFGISTLPADFAVPANA